MNTSHRIVIVGASIAGLTAAESLRSEGFDGEILLLGSEPHLPYSRPPLSKQVLLGTWDPDETRIKSYEQLLDLGVNFRPSSPAESLDAKQRIIRTREGEESFDQLIIATGSSARQLPYDGVWTLRTVDDAINLRKRIANAKKIAVVGAGVLGSEIASAAVQLGAEVHLIGKSSEISFGSVGSALSSRIEALHLAHGVYLRLGTEVLDVTIEDQNANIILGDERTLSVNLAVAAIGAIPCTNWLSNSGIDVSNGVICNEVGLAAPDIYAIGDVASWKDSATGLSQRVEHQTSAIEQAMAVAATIVNQRHSKPVAPFFWSELHGVSIKSYGWFDAEPLNELSSISSSGTLLQSEKFGKTYGVISWNASTKEFREARTLVDKSRDFFKTDNKVKDQP